MNRFFILLAFSFLFFSCRKDEEQTDDNLLKLISEFSIDIEEPSGLVYDAVANSIWLVSDNTNKIYKISSEGRIFQSLNYIGNDLEAVALDEDRNIWVAEERLRRIVKIDKITNDTISYKIQVENNSDNSGLEGLTYNSNDKCFYILNEKNPGKLLKYSKQMQILSSFSLSFANDNSELAYDVVHNKLWILSDEDQSLNYCELNGQLIKSYKTNIIQAEGLAIDTANHLMYIASDQTAKLYQFEYPNL
ncbi:MAG: SdiA-regulated domain-containing protein [Bacteroidales bacterium]|nr:SdiA-regulated domain-containing protein [Bacteroidales bacterium]